MWFSATYILAHMLFSEICSKHQTNPYRPNPISKYVTAYQFCTTLHILPTEGKAYIEEKFKKEKSTSDVAKHTKHASAIGKAPTQFQAALNAGDGRRDWLLRLQGASSFSVHWSYGTRLSWLRLILCSLLQQRNLQIQGTIFIYLGNAKELTVTFEFGLWTEWGLWWVRARLGSNRWTHVAPTSHFLQEVYREPTDWSVLSCSGVGQLISREEFSWMQWYMPGEFAAYGRRCQGSADR